MAAMTQISHCTGVRRDVGTGCSAVAIVTGSYLRDQGSRIGDGEGGIIMRALKERGLRTMSKRFAGSMIAIAAAAVAVVWLLAAARDSDQGEAQKAPGRASSPTPRTADGRVDFSGIWGTDRKFIYDINDALKPGETLPIQPWALKVTRERLS